MRCPICDKKFAIDDENAALPFCSVRCKAIDAKRWLNEEYSFESVNLDRREEEIAGLEDETSEEPGDN